MLEQEIQEEIEQIVLKSIEKLKTENVVKVPYIPINKYVEVFEKLGTYDDFETNGWDVDFWLYFYINDIKYCLAGSWYYGGYSIYKG